MKKKMKIYYHFDNKRQNPMIRISNSQMTKYGFEIGDEIEVSYKKNKITITKVIK